MLETFEIEATAPRSGSVIWMHGLGASNRDFESLVPELATPHLRFVFPAAPVRAVTINGGARMPAWYDILSFSDPPLREHEPDVREAATAITELIEREIDRGVPASRIALVGFSQGAAMALHVGLRSPRRLAGAAILSGYLLLPQRLQEERSPECRDLPLFFAHGSFDPTVPLTLGKLAYDRVAAEGYPATFEEYPMQHSMCLEEAHALKRWLLEVID